MTDDNKLQVTVTRRGNSIRIRTSKSGMPLTQDLIQLQILEYELANTRGEPHSKVPRK